MEAKINCSYSEALIFVWLKDKKTKENGISNLQENGPHSLDEGNPYIKTNLHTGCFRKVAKKQGTKIASWAHIYMVFSIKQIHWQNVWHSHNLLCKKWVWINHNPMKLEINKPGAAPQIFVRNVWRYNQKLTHRPEEHSTEKTRKPRKSKKFYLFSFVFACKNLIHAIFWSLNFIFHQIPALVEFPDPGQLSKVKSRPSGQVFWDNPPGLPGGCTSWNWLRHKCQTGSVIS